MLKKSLLLSGLLLASLPALSQFVSGDIIQAPCNGDGVYEVTTTGVTLPITYTYYVNGQTIVHANVNSATDQVTGFDMSTSGSVGCNVSASNINTWTFSYYTPSFNYDIDITNPTCPATMGTITANLSSGSPAGPMTYTWLNPTTAQSYSGQSVQVPYGTYEGTILDQASGCKLVVIDSLLQVYQLSSVTASITTTPAACTDGTATAVASGGQAPYTYQWVNGSTQNTISNLTQGNYGVTVTDAQGCTSGNMNAYVSQNPTISINTNVTNATCLQNDGELMAFASGGQGPYTYMWSDGQTGQQATNLIGGNVYTVVATDANGCIGAGVRQVGINTPITVTYTSTPSSCNVDDGTATLSIFGGTPPYAISWNSVQGNGTNVLSNVGKGTYAFVITDANGCVRTGAAVVDQAGTLTASINRVNPTCPSTTGNAIVNVQGSNPPFTYSWSNGATANYITNVPVGYYACTITDAQGCVITKNASIYQETSISASVSTTPVSCQFNSDGAATAYGYGGTAPYTYQYSNGATTQSVTGLSMGSNGVTITDANGCSASKSFVIYDDQTSDDCYCIIEGHVYVDANSNCTMDGGEAGVDNVMVHCAGHGYTFTNSAGYYKFKVPSGTYTITEQVNQYYPLASCQTPSTTVTVVAASNCVNTVNFANNMVTLSDLKISAFNFNIPPIPGNPYKQRLWIRNEGTVQENDVQVGYQHDGQLMYNFASSSNFVQDDPMNEPYHFGVSSGFPSMNANSEEIILLHYNTPTDIPLGTSIQAFDSAANAASIQTNYLLDNTPWNNVHTFGTTVIGAYDPNYKEVAPAGIGTEGYISSLEKEFDYTIHFQNEGTYFAQKIVITDQLDDDFDWTSLKPGYSPYPYTTDVNETGLVTFTFNDINLPWKSQYGNDLSSSLVNYSIKRKPNLPQGTVFENTANIFFDFNAPITTNTTKNTIDDSQAGIEDIEAAIEKAEARTLELFPVPTSDVLTIRLNNVRQNEKAHLSIISITGTEVASRSIDLQEGTTVFTQQVADLAPGTYLTRVVFQDGSSLLQRMIVR